jgi:hypothetical protein
MANRKRRLHVVAVASTAGATAVTTRSLTLILRKSVKANG